MPNPLNIYNQVAADPFLQDYTMLQNMYQQDLAPLETAINENMAAKEKSIAAMKGAQDQYQQWKPGTAQRYVAPGLIALGTILDALKGSRTQKAQLGQKAMGYANAWQQGIQQRREQERQKMLDTMGMAKIENDLADVRFEGRSKIAEAKSAARKAAVGGASDAQRARAEAAENRRKAEVEQKKFEFEKIKLQLELDSKRREYERQQTEDAQKADDALYQKVVDFSAGVAKPYDMAIQQALSEGNQEYANQLEDAKEARIQAALLKHPIFKKFAKDGVTFTNDLSVLPGQNQMAPAGEAQLTQQPAQEPAKPSRKKTDSDLRAEQFAKTNAAIENALSQLFSGGLTPKRRIGERAPAPLSMNRNNSFRQGHYQ